MLDTQTSRTHLTRSIGWLIFWTNVAFVPTVWALGYWSSVQLGLVFLAIYLVAVLSTYVVRPALATHVLAFAGLTHILLSVSLTGGVGSTASLTVLLIPTAATLMAGGRAGWFWLVAGFLGLAVVNAGPETWLLGELLDLSPTARGWVMLSILVPTGVCLQAAMWVFANQRARAEEALTESMSELEARVLARTAELQVEVQQRRTAEARAQASNDAKTAFLMNMSHELRTPLNAIKGYAELVDEALATPNVEMGEARDDLGHIVVASTHLLGLIDGILEFARVEADELPYQPTSLNVVALVRETIGVLEPVVRGRGNTLVLDPMSPQGAPVLADRSWVRQILFNLISNASKYTDGGRITVQVRLDPGAVRIAVVDDGPGIHPELLPKVFDRFTRGHGVTVSGTGLGLAISKALTERMGGRLRATSTLGEGSTFELELRRAPS